MQMFRGHLSAIHNLTIGIGIFVLLALLPIAVRADAIEIEGMASVPYAGGVFSNHPDEATRQQALRLAESDAVSRYVANFSAAKFKLYQRVEKSILDNIGDYISQPTIVDQGIKKEDKSYYIVIRTSINTDRFDSAISASGSEGAAAGTISRKISISFLFVARSTSSVREFDARVTKVEKSDNNKSAKQTESLSGGRATFSSISSDTTANTTGGSTLRQADQSTYVVSSPEDMNAAMSQVFSDGGFDVYDYRDVSSQCAGMKPELVYKAFSTSDMLTGATRKAVFDSAKKCGVNTFAIGTLDIGLQDTDPVTGQKRVYVSLRTQINDLSSMLPRVLASVGPIQYSGLGPDQEVAMRNALITAATEAAREISNQLKSKGLN